MYQWYNVIIYEPNCNRVERGGGVHPFYSVLPFFLLGTNRYSYDPLPILYFVLTTPPQNPGSTPQTIPKELA